MEVEEKSWGRRREEFLMHNKTVIPKKEVETILEIIQPYKQGICSWVSNNNAK